jgi:hypothetical protein
LDAELLHTCGDVAGKLESLCFDKVPGQMISVFKTGDVRDLFARCMHDLGYRNEEAAKFSIDKWFNSVLKTVSAKDKPDYDIDPNKTMQRISNPWLLALLEMEIKIPHFIKILKNMLEYEAKLYESLQVARKNAQYTSVYDDMKLLPPTPSHSATYYIDCPKKK